MPDREWPRFNRPKLPDRVIHQRGEVRIIHYFDRYPDPNVPGVTGEHPPGYLHVEGGGPSRKIGRQGYVLAGEGELTFQQQAVVADAHVAIKRALKKVSQHLRYVQETSSQDW